MGKQTEDYCDKCGWFWVSFSHDKKDNKKCEICGNALKPVPDEYYEESHNIYFVSNKMQQKLIEDLVKTSPNFDQYYFDNAINIKGQQDASFKAKMDHGRAILEGRDKGNKFGVSCPYCNATNVRKITVVSKALHTSMFGIFSIGRNSKNYHCTRCGSDF